MATINKIKGTDNNIYDLEVDWSNVTNKAKNILQTKVFDDVWSAPIGKTTAEAKAMNSGASGTQDGSTVSSQYRIYFGKIRPTGIDKTNTTTATRTWTSSWHIRMNISVRMFYRNGSGEKIYHENGKASYDCHLYGNGTTLTYSNFNNRYDWTPTYYFMVNRPVANYMKSVNDSPYLWGINFYSTNSTYSNRSYYKREYTIDVLECDGCTIEFLDDWQCARNYHIANASVHPRNAQTNYYGYCYNSGSSTDNETAGFTDYDSVNNGLRESGDDNSTDAFYYYAPVKAGGQGIHGYAIIAELENGTFASFTTNSGTSSASAVKVANTTDEFLYGGHTLYYTTNNNTSAGANASVASRWSYYAFDTRYISNYYGTSASSNPTLAFAYSGSGTTATYSQAWIKVEFTADKKKYKVKSLLLNDRDRTALGAGYYMLIGSNYNSAGEYYRIATMEAPVIYYVDENGKLSIPNFLSTVATSGSYNDLSNKPTIPSAVTESTVSGWGFTKNTGTYSKPSTGIPKTDLASAVQTSLGKADTALQSHQSLAGYATETWVTNKGYTTNTGTITGIKMNGASKGTSGVVDLGTVITAHQSLSAYTPTANLADVALNGEYGSLLNLPVVPTVVSELPNDAGYLDSTSFITTGGQTIVDSGALVSYSTSWNVASVGGASNAYTFYLEVIETSVNTDAKTSAVTYKVYAKGNNNYSYNNFSAPTVTIKVDGTSLGAVNVTSISTTKKLVATKSNTVTHNADGTKTISVTVQYANAETSYLPKPHTSSAYSVTLSTFTETEGVDIAGIRTPNGKVYNLADTYAREQIESIANVGYEMITATNLVGRKWANGFLEYWIKKAIPAGAYTAWQSHYYRTASASVTYPTPFVNALGILAQYDNPTAYASQPYPAGTTATPNVRLMAFTNQSSLTGNLYIYTWGYWK